MKSTEPEQLTLRKAAGRRYKHNGKQKSENKKQNRKQKHKTGKDIIKIWMKKFTRQ